MWSDVSLVQFLSHMCTSQMAGSGSSFLFRNSGWSVSESERLLGTKQTIQNSKANWCFLSEALGLLFVSCFINQFVVFHIWRRLRLWRCPSRGEKARMCSFWHWDSRRGRSCSVRTKLNATYKFNLQNLWTLIKKHKLFWNNDCQCAAPCGLKKRNLHKTELDGQNDNYGRECLQQ